MTAGRHCGGRRRRWRQRQRRQGRVEQEPRKPKLTAHAELCYDTALAAPAARQDFPKEANICGVSPGSSLTGTSSNLTVSLHGQQLQIVVTTRSVFGIFTYLGGMIAHGDIDSGAAARLSGVDLGDHGGRAPADA